MISRINYPAGSPRATQLRSVVANLALDRMPETSQNQVKAKMLKVRTQSNVLDGIKGPDLQELRENRG